PCFTDPGSAEIDTIGAGAAGGGGGAGAGAGAGAGLTAALGGERGLVMPLARLAFAVASSRWQKGEKSWASRTNFAAAAYSLGHSLSLPACLAASRALSAAVSSGTVNGVDAQPMSPPTRKRATVIDSSVLRALSSGIVFSFLVNPSW